MDLYTVHYNDKAGGDTAPLTGAADPTREEYYPSFSSDDKNVEHWRRITVGLAPD
jgi:hypothetical protein